MRKSNSKFNLAKSQPQLPPDHFGIVECNIYRSSIPQLPAHFTFISLLKLKTILFLAQEVPAKILQQYVEASNVQFINMGLISSSSTLYLREELVKEALEMILDKTTHPIMIMCTSGLHLTGTIVGCLRRLQYWSLTSILDEYRSFAGSKARYANEMFIEMFDRDLIALPDIERLPAWFQFQVDLMRKEKEEYTKTKTEQDVNRSVTLSKDDNRLAFQLYFYSVGGPLHSSKSTYSEASLVDDDDLD